MHRDKKIGFALGILLLGIVAAFFFRNEPDPFAELPPLDDPQALDGQIADKPNAPYADEPNPAEAKRSARGQINPWALPEIYRPTEARPSAETGLYNSPAAPAPINLEAPVPVEPQSPGGAIEVGNPFGESARNLPRFGEDKSSKDLPGNEAWTTVPQRAPENASAPKASVVKNEKPVSEPTSSPLTAYKIQKGDTLSVLAEKHLGSSRRYMEIYDANRDKLRNPDDIQVGMTIRIPARVKFNGQGVQKAPPKPPENQNRQSSSRPEEAGRFRPFSRSPLGPLRY